MACFNGHKDVVQLLLKYIRIELNARDNGGTTAFTWACKNGHKDVVKLLLDHSEGIELNARNYCRGWTAFKIACRYGQTDVVKLLLDHFERIDLNARYQIGKDDKSRPWVYGTHCSYMGWAMDPIFAWISWVPRGSFWVTL